MTDQQKYIVSARKYRPATFRSVVGQKTLTSTLKNAILTDRLAQAYLFCGPRGVGKTSCARIFAKTINCTSLTPEGEACGQCEACRAFEEGSSFNVIELDAASNNSVNDIRDLTDQVQTPPSNGGRYRVFIIDEVHMLTSQAFNAFLKTLEEPPSYVIFILATTEKHKVIPTILSRCQIYDFKRITIQDMVEHLQYVAQSEGINAEPSALGVIARKADGAMRDALSIFDQVAASSHGEVTYQKTIDNLNVLDAEVYFRLVEAFRNGDIPESLVLWADIRARGFDALFFINGLASHIRDLMMAVDARTLPLLEVAEDMAPRFTEQARTMPVQWYYAALRILSDADVAYRTSGNKQLLVELSLIRLCQLLNPPAPPFDRIEEPPALRDPSAPYGPSPAQPARIPTQAQSAPQASGNLTTAHTAPAVSTAVPASVTPPDPAAATRATAASGQPATPDLPKVSGNAPSPLTDSKAPSAGTAVRRRTRRATTMRISDVEQAAGTISAPSVGQGAAEPVTDQGLRQAWHEFAATHPEHRILSSSMRSTLPVRTGETSFAVTVGHPAHAQAFESAMSELMEYLRSSLRNDALTLEVRIDDTRAETEKPFVPRDFLIESIEANPALGTLLQALDTELV